MKKMLVAIATVASVMGGGVYSFAEDMSSMGHEMKGAIQADVDAMKGEMKGEMKAGTDAVRGKSDAMKAMSLTIQMDPTLSLAPGFSPMPFGNSMSSSRRDNVKIAQRFNAGWQGGMAMSPGGTAEAFGRPSGTHLVTRPDPALNHRVVLACPGRTAEASSRCSDTNTSSNIRMA